MVVSIRYVTKNDLSQVEKHFIESIDMTEKKLKVAII